MRIRLAVLAALFALTPAFAADKPTAPDSAGPPALKLRLVKDGWGGASLADAEQVLKSAGKQLLAHFPGAELAPVRVYPIGGPITLFRRDADGSIVVKLATTGRLWAQYSFQFAHELGHIMCRYDANNTGHLWLEESLCELSSLYTLRSMAEDWKANPPYSNWKSYGAHLKEYAQKRIDEHPLPPGQSLAKWYRDNADALSKNATDRPRNTTVAAALLPLFEKSPQHWKAVYYLNQGKPKGPQTFAQRLQNWHDQTPAEHQAFVREIAERFEVTLVVAVPKP
jgi:hypothetical protein